MTQDENISEITIIYTVNPNEESIKIFGSGFVNNNRDNCKIVYDNKEYELNKEFDVKNVKDKLEIKLKGVNKVTNMSNLFSGCLSLSSLPDISKINTTNITNMCNMFNGCSTLTSLPEISNWNTENVTDMSFMFCGCSSLKSLPDISKWNTANVTNMDSMFYECKSLSELPDISTWNTSNVTNMGYMFYGCSELKTMPNIAKWNIGNASKDSMFSGCNENLLVPLKFFQ